MSSIITRFTDIMQANINSVLSRAEDKNADKLLEKYLRDAVNNLERVKSETAAVIADEKAAERKLNECKDGIAKYEKYAVSAVKVGEDSDARKFLQAKADLTANLETLTKAYELAKSNSAKMRQMTDKLTDDISKAREKMTVLKAKLNMAEQQEKQAEFMQKLSGNSGMGNMDNLFDKVQKRIDKAEAMMELNTDNESEELSELEKKYSEGGNDIEKELNAIKSSDSAIDDELAKLKSELNV